MLHVLKQRMYQGRLAKARRGELAIPVPTGYVRRPSGEVAFDPDEQVQTVVEMRVDCDQDALWLKVRVAGDGGCCHTGRRSCFYRRVESGPSFDFQRTTSVFHSVGNFTFAFACVICMGVKSDTDATNTSPGVSDV